MKIDILTLVEAAGVEPASEKARHEENYVRSAVQKALGSTSEPARAVVP
jgi:hypothetical protein